MSAPVIPAVRLLGMVPAVALNVAEVVPAATETDPGTGSSPVLLESATEAPPDDAAWFKVTVHVVEAPVVSVVGLQESELKVGSGTVTVPPLPLAVMLPPAGDAAARFEIPMVVERATFVIVTVATATTPSCMVLSFGPSNRQVVAPVVGKQVIVFPAAVAFAPAATVTLATLAVA